jgi:hypothetical protein
VRFVCDSIPEFYNGTDSRKFLLAAQMLSERAPSRTKSHFEYEAYRFFSVTMREMAREADFRDWNFKPYKSFFEALSRA